MSKNNWTILGLFLHIYKLTQLFQVNKSLFAENCCVVNVYTTQHMGVWSFHTNVLPNPDIGLILLTSTKFMQLDTCAGGSSTLRFLCGCSTGSLYYKMEAHMFNKTKIYWKIVITTLECGSTNRHAQQLFLKRASINQHTYYLG